MGMDFYIECSIVDKKTKKQVYNFDIAYWRKAWALTGETMRFVETDSYCLEAQGDWLRIAKRDILPEIIELYASKISNRYCEYWTNAVWAEPLTTIMITLSNLRALCAADSILNADYIYDMPNVEDNIAAFREDYSEELSRLESELDTEDNFDEYTFVKYLVQPAGYEIQIRFINSY